MFVLFHLFASVSSYCSGTGKFIHHVVLLLTPPLLRKEYIPPFCCNVISVTIVNVFDFFVFCQDVFEVSPILNDVVHMTTDAVWSFWMKYPSINLGFFPHQLCKLKILVYMSASLLMLIPYLLFHLMCPPLQIPTPYMSLNFVMK